jgi:hypothetical protein
MIEKTYLDMLTQDNVSLRKQNVMVIGGKEYAIGEPWRRAYVNSVQGREQVQAEVPESYRSVIMLMWGNGPTVTEVME